MEAVRDVLVVAVEADDGVGEPAGLPDDRDRSVGQRVHLGQPARLEARRHDEGVYAGLDPVREHLVVAEEGAEGAVVLRFQAAHRPLEGRLAGAEHDDPEPAPDQLGRGLEEEVEALLVDEAADRPEHHSRVARLEAGDPEELVAALGLPGHVARAVERRQVRVVGGVPDRPVDPVEDPDETAGAAPEDLVEPAAPLGGLDLPGEGGGDGRDDVGGLESPFQEADSPLELEEPAGADVLGEPQRREEVVAVGPLVLDVVDRQHRRDVVEPPVPPAAPRAEHRREGGVPVVSVEDLGLLSEPPHSLDGGPDEDGEPPEAVVGPRVARGVEAGAPVEERVVRDEVDGHAVVRELPLQDPDAVGTPEDRDVERRRRLDRPLQPPPVPLRCLEVEGDPDVDVVAAPCQGLRERPDDVAESARLGERAALGGKMTDSQRSSWSAPFSRIPPAGGVGRPGAAPAAWPDRALGLRGGR